MPGFGRASAGGTASNGDLNLRGGPSLTHEQTNVRDASGNLQTTGGTGGASFWGPSPAPQYVGSNAHADGTAGANGSGGNGACGANINGGGNSNNGGAGGAGVVVIFEYQ